MPKTQFMKKQQKTQELDTHFRVMVLIQKKPKITQRELAKEMGISLGSVHYCLKALVLKGWVKVGRFKHNPDKSAYLYLLTPEGVVHKSKLTLGFLKRKKQEYDQIKREIDQLSKELRDGS